MKRWTQENTTGFSDAELNTINQAKEILEDKINSRRDENTDSFIDDCITNNWLADSAENTVDKLVSRVLGELNTF